MSYSTRIGINDIHNAYNRIKPFVHKTPVFTSTTFNNIIGRNAFFKLENLQKTGSFKARGALNSEVNWIHNYAPKAQQILVCKEKNPDLNGVTTHSCGNHGIGVAWAASMAGVKCCTVIINTASKVKVESVEAHGAEIVYCDPSPPSRVETCSGVAKERGYEIILSSGNYDTIAGQGTIAVELLEQVPDLDAILVSASGGGMISGIAIAAKNIKKDIKVFMVEPKGKHAEQCIRTGKRLWPNPPRRLDTIADGITTQQIEDLAFPIICDLVEKDVFTVDDEDIIKGMKFVYQHMKLVIEAAAGATVAAAMSEKLKQMDPKMKKIGIVVCGGNVDIDSLPWYRHS